MKSVTAKVAAAAVIVVTCALALSMWHETTQVALADVLAKVEQVQAYLYRETGTTQDAERGTSTSQLTVLVSNEYGMKSEQTMVDANGVETRMWTYVLPREKSLVIVDSENRQYARLGLDDATWENIRIQSRDPRAMVKRLLACEYTELGTAVIDGIKAQGFETTDPTYLGDVSRKLSARLWVAVDTWLPVRYELESEIREGIHVSSVSDGYQWDIPVDAGEFEPDIPADFTANPMDGTQMPSYSEQGMIEALQTAAEFTGHYPDKLDSDTLHKFVSEMTSAFDREDASPAVQRFREELKGTGSKEAAMQVSQSRFMKLMTLTMFPLILGQQGAEPVYHGDVVTPSDTTLPLMRWKTADNEYRVIFGDLHTATVTGEELQALEAGLPK